MTLCLNDRGKLLRHLLLTNQLLMPHGEQWNCNHSESAETGQLALCMYERLDV